MIRDVEELGAELHPQTFAWNNILEERNIEVVHAGSADGVVWGGPYSKRPGDLAERGRVEVARQRLATPLVRVADDVRALASGAAAEVCHVAGLSDINRQPALEGSNAGDLP